VILMGYCKKYVSSYDQWFYLLFRVLVGGIFFLHGYGKLFAGGQATGLMLVAGVIEVVVGAGIFLGFFNRLLAWVGGIQMIVAYFKVHASNGLNPLANGGELALLFLAAFLIVAIYGNGETSLEQSLLNKETF
jgi:putative oxidoreductase